VELLEEIGAFAGLVAFVGLALLALLTFTQGRDIRRLREWAGSAPERDAERKEAASERAEEMRAQDEPDEAAASSEAERRAAELREVRRQRREAGLPELTRGERLRERFDSSRLGEPRYLAAAFAAFVLLVAGGAYAAVEGLGGDDGGKGGKSRKAAAPKPGEIEVTVLNGTAVPGLAATYGDVLERKGFQLGDVTNSESSFADSVVMFEPGNGREAHLVARAVEVARVRPMTSDIVAVSGGAPVSVVVGEDNASTAG
jgi:hypothetical protein